MVIQIKVSAEQCERLDFLVEHYGSENVDSLVNFLIHKHHLLLVERQQKEKRENLIQKYKSKTTYSEVRHTL